MSSVAKSSTLDLNLRPSEARGGANHGWLKTFHTFSFAEYVDFISNLHLHV